MSGLQRVGSRKTDSAKATPCHHENFLYGAPKTYFTITGESGDLSLGAICDV